MPATHTEAPTLRIGTRVLLLDQDDHVLLIHAKPQRARPSLVGATRRWR